MVDDEFQSLENTIKSLTGAITQMSNAMRTANSSARGFMGGGFGQLGIGSVGQNFLAGSLGDTTSLQNILYSSRAANLKYGSLIGLAQAGMGSVAGVGMMMPGLQPTLGRAASFYNAGLMSGVNGYRLGANTLRMMNGGLTGVGSDAEVAGTLSGMGVMAGTSQYNNLVRSTANAAKYLNMPNATAAAAFGGLTSGATSRSLMQNFGMYTTNPITGERYSPNQIFEQLNQRFTLGQNLTREDIMTSLQGGALAVNLQNSGLDSNQQALLAQYMLDRASGKSAGELNYGDDTAMDKLSKDNPFKAQYAINASDTGVMQAAGKAYVDGMNAVVPTIKNLNKVSEKLVGTFGSLNASLQTLLSNNAVMGAGTALGGIGTGLATFAGAKLANKGLEKTMQSLGVSPKPAPGTPAAAGAKNFKGTMKAGGALAALNVAMSIPGNMAATEAGYGGSAWGGTIGSTVGGLAGAAIGQALIPIPYVGAIIGGMAGSALGNMAGQAIGSAFDAKGGESSTISLGGTSGTGKPDFAAPVRGKITCKYGVVDKMHPNGHHGVDYGVGEGTAIQSIGAGTVSGSYWSDALGNVVKITHAGGYASLYAHLQTSLVKPGDNVVKGQVIAKSGNTGSATTGAHLHLEVYQNGGRIDPLSVLGGVVAAVTGSASSGAGAQDASGMSGSGSGASSLGFSSDYKSVSAAAVPSSYKGSSAVAGAIKVSGMSSGVSNGRGHVSQAGTSSVSNKNTGGGEVAGGSVTNEVTINLSIGEATESEARKFAQMVKGYLEKDSLMTSMGTL